MKFIRGQLVQHPKMPEWGIGQILEDCHGGKARVYFKEVGAKTLNLDHVNLIEVDVGEGTRLSSEHLNPLPNFDTVKVRRLCEEFIFEMKDNRTGYNDAGMAEDILHDIESGRFRRSTIKRLGQWCTTEGTAFQRGISIAQDISMAIFGQIIRRP
jgi:Protein of unknown function (DUF3553)